MSSPDVVGLPEDELGRTSLESGSFRAGRPCRAPRAGSYSCPCDALLGYIPLPHGALHMRPSYPSTNHLQPSRIPTSFRRGPQQKCSVLQEPQLAPGFRPFLLDHQTQRGHHGLETCIGFADSATQLNELTQLLQIWTDGEEQKGMERKDDGCVCICSPI